MISVSAKGIFPYRVYGPYLPSTAQQPATLSSQENGFPAIAIGQCATISLAMDYMVFPEARTHSLHSRKVRHLIAVE